MRVRICDVVVLALKACMGDPKALRAQRRQSIVDVGSLDPPAESERARGRRSEVGDAEFGHEK